jgi:bifunctional DNA-binding transcriptional regulator/antitoxin component of YhaV-PrlF toxin-antitoxin module
MNKEYKFQAIIVDAGGGGAFVRIPFDVEEAFGKKRVPVNTSIDNVPYRGTLVRMGEPNHILIILKEIRHAIGKNPGDTVEISLREDTEPRVVEIPPDLRQALDQEPLVRDAFDKLSYTHQREHVRAILDARREETRQNRIAKTVQMLLQTSKDP